MMQPDADKNIHVADLEGHVPPEQQLAFLRTLVDSTVDAIIVHDPAGCLVFFNHAACELLKLPAKEMRALEPYGWVGPDSQQGAPTRLEYILHERRHTFLSTAQRSDGSVVPTEVTASRVDTIEGPLIVAVIRDISDRHHAEQRLEYLAYHDALTGLANRAAFDERLRIAIADSKRYGDLLMLAYVDLDRFKPVNDEHGHEAGDMVLIEIGSRLVGGVRAQDLVARLGGDEFVVLMQRVESTDEIVNIAERLLDAIRLPINASGTYVSIDASIGFAIFDAGVDDARSLVVKADVAMYEAKREESAPWRLYEPSMGMFDSLE
jgi:diguanylate cyclase (GGDEF)-like protein/PAS domain S-box-containing protein